MVTGDHEAGPSQAAHQKPETCGFGWNVPQENESHICRLPKNHPPPHHCTLNTTCQATHTE